MSNTPPSPSEAILAMQSRHKQTLELNGILDKIIRHGLASQSDAHLTEVADGWPVVLGSTHEDTTHVYVAFQNDAGYGESLKTASRIVHLGMIAAGAAQPNEQIGITATDFAIVSSLYNDALYHKKHIAPDYNVELGL